ncbi:MAG: hypothetical protein GVY31_02440 [Alphaproteobacteria bacterium]|jgi:transposase-like protein|nr:hypothetical protein [Alphaproteobacteria bacterium]
MSFEHKSSVSMPTWVPEHVRQYLLHTVYGQSIRSLARRADCHASTIMRQVRKVEQRREDPLMDEALRVLAADGADGAAAVSNLEQLQALRRLAEPSALLAVAQDMGRGVIVRDGAGTGPDLAEPLDLRVARALVVRGFLDPGTAGGRIMRYRISGAGRAALRDLIARSENRAREMAEAPTPFTHAKGVDEESGAQMRSTRLAAADSPVRALARRKDKFGDPFLTPAMVHAAERLREDFEVAHIGQRVSQDWQAMMTGPRRGGGGQGSRMDIKARLERAFEALGPGLAEVVYRTCCLLDGLEQTEKTMGWSARSGKIVLRIALDRLVEHYRQTGQLGSRYN